MGDLIAEDEAILDNMVNDDHEIWHFVTDYLLDESMPQLTLMLKEVIKTNPDLNTLGEIFVEAYKNCENSYLTMMRED